jgi:hypothetical protein
MLLLYLLGVLICFSAIVTFRCKDDGQIDLQELAYIGFLGLIWPIPVILLICLALLLIYRDLVEKIIAKIPCKVISCNFRKLLRHSKKDNE